MWEAEHADDESGCSTVLFLNFTLEKESQKPIMPILQNPGAEHADEGSRRVKTLLPSSVTDNGFAELDIKDYTTIADNFFDRDIGRSR